LSLSCGDWNTRGNSKSDRNLKPVFIALFPGEAHNNVANLSIMASQNDDPSLREGLHATVTARP
jgi:hypothetical protein